MTVHRASDRLSAHRATNVYSRTIYLVWEHKTKLIAHQCCDQLTGIRWPVSPDRTAGLSVHPSVSRIVWSYPLTNYQVQMIEGSSLFFPMIHMKYVVFISLWPRTIRILISNWPRTRKFRQLLKNTGGEDLFLPWSRTGHALRPLFMLWLVKIWQVSSCGKYMQHLESCLLWQLKLTKFCVNLWCF